MCIRDRFNDIQGISAEVIDESGVDGDISFANALDIVELIMAFEEEFDIEIPDDAAEKIKTVKKDVYKRQPLVCAIYTLLYTEGFLFLYFYA